MLIVAESSIEAIKKYLNYMIGDDIVRQVFIIVFTVLIFNFIFYRILNKLHKKLQLTQNPWDDAFIDAIKLPVRYLVWVIGISFAADIIATNIQARDVAKAVSSGLNPRHVVGDGMGIFAAIDPIRKISIVFLIAWFLLRLVKNTEINIIALRKEQDKQIDHTTLQAVVKLVRVSIHITATLVALQSAGLQIAGVLAFGGIGGMAVGFAAKDLLANFFGAMMIYMDRPFAVGDWVRSPDRKIEGTVEAIGWRLTRIRTFSKRPLYVPNSVFTNVIVENPSRMTNRRIYETIGIRYDDSHKIENIIKSVKLMLRDHEEIDQSQTQIVNFNSFAPSSLDFFIYVFTKTTNWIRFHEIKQDVMLKINAIIGDAGAEIAFPTSTLHLADKLEFDRREQRE